MTFFSRNSLIVRPHKNHPDGTQPDYSLLFTCPETAVNILEHTGNGKIINRSKDTLDFAPWFKRANSNNAIQEKNK